MIGFYHVKEKQATDCHNNTTHKKLKTSFTCTSIAQLQSESVASNVIEVYHGG